jgi:hypothetical protein
MDPPDAVVGLVDPPPVVGLLDPALDEGASVVDDPPVVDVAAVLVVLAVAVLLVLFESLLHAAATSDRTTAALQVSAANLER